MPPMLVDMSNGCKYAGKKCDSCPIHAYTVYTSISGKGRCHTTCDLWDHHMQARKSAGKRSTPDLKPVRKDTQSPNQEQSVTPQTWPWSNKKKKKKNSDWNHSILTASSVSGLKDGVGMSRNITLPCQLLICSLEPWIKWFLISL